MVEVKDIVDRESLEAWLDDQGPKAYPAIVYRVTMRLLPLYWDWVLFSDFAITSNLNILQALWPSLISGVTISASNPIVPLELKKNAKTSAMNAMDALVNVDPFISSAAGEDNLVSLGYAVAFVADDDPDSALSGAIIVSENLEFDIWPAIQHDCEKILLGTNLCLEPLWAKNPARNQNTHWDKLLSALEGDESNWSFWIKWYEAVLNGVPLNWEMLEKIALIPSEDWEKGPAHVNDIIAKIEEEFFLALTPISEKVELNLETGRLRIVPERMSQKALYSNILEKIRDGMADLRGSPQFDNALSALGPVFEKVLDRTFDKYLSSPQRVHDDFIKAKRRIQKLLDVGEVAPNDEVIELVEDLDSGAAHIRANMPQVRESMAALAALRIAEASDADIEGIRAGAEAIAEMSEPEMAEQMREDAAEIVASRDAPLGAPKVLMPEETYRLSHRIVESKQILTKANLIKVAKGVRAGFGDTQIVMAIPYAVEILLRLLQY